MVSEYEKSLLVFSGDAEIEEMKRIERSIRRSLPSVGIACTNGVVIASATRTSKSALMEKDNLSSVFDIGEYAGMVSAGRVADAQSLADTMRDKALDDISEYGELEDVNVLVKEVAEDVRRTRQEIPCRPYGVQMIVGGVNGRGENELYKIDLDGVITSWSAVAVGSNTDKIMDELEDQYDQSKNIDEGAEMAISVLLEHSGVDDPDGLSVATVTADDGLHRLDTNEITEYRSDKNSGEGNNKGDNNE